MNNYPDRDKMAATDAGAIDTDAAWRKLQAKLALEPAPAQWEQLAEPRRGGEAPIAQAPGDTTVAAEPAQGVAIASQEPATCAPRPVATSRRRGWMRAATAACAVCVAAVLFASPWGDRALASVLKTFRIQQFVLVNNADLTQVRYALENSGVDVRTLDLQQFGKMEVSGSPQSKQMTLTEAARVVDFPIVTPAGFQADVDKLQVTTGEQLTFQLATGPINQMIRRLGGKTSLPDAADGQTISLTIPASVEWNSRADWSKKEQYDQRMRFRQMKAPELAVPDAVDPEPIRQALLDLPFLPGDIRKKLEEIKDWHQASSLPIPVMNGGSEKVRSLTLNGMEAVLQSNDWSRSIMWTANGFVYELSGGVGRFPNDEALISQAKELAQR